MYDDKAGPIKGFQPVNPSSSVERGIENPAYRSNRPSIFSSTEAPGCPSIGANYAPQGMAMPVPWGYVSPLRHLPARIRTPGPGS